MSHSTKPRSHEENRSVLCGICYKKQAELRPITDIQVQQIHALIDSSYSIDDTRFQKVICRVCALALTAHTKNPDNPGRKLFHPKYSNLNPPPVHATRQTERRGCTCTICKIAKTSLTPR